MLLFIAPSSLSLFVFVLKFPATAGLLYCGFTFECEPYPYLITFIPSLRLCLILMHILMVAEIVSAMFAVRIPKHRFPFCNGIERHI